ncbi:MAG TPA: S8 family serine peptidase, partial [Methanospirillum sp.]|nr:S8 family serine peptidase [Methanospirillum sp.]
MSHRVLFIRFLILTTVIALIGIGITTGTQNLSLHQNNPNYPISYTPPIIEKNVPPNLWQQKLTTDLVQLLDPVACSPGKEPADTANILNRQGLLRFDKNSSPEVAVMITIKTGGTAKLVLPLLANSSSDLSDNIIGGWIHISDLPKIASYEGVKQISTSIPSVGSSLSYATEHYQSTAPDANSTATSVAISPGTPLEPLLIHSDMPGNNQSGDSEKWRHILSTDLLQLVDTRYLSPGQSSDNAVKLMNATGVLRKGPDGIGEVIITARGDPDAIRNVRNFFRIMNSDPLTGRIAGWITLENMTKVAQEGGIISIMTQIPPYTSGIKTEGDALIHANDLRNSTNLTGKGIKIGIISDGVESIQQIIDAGDLPQNTTIIRNNYGGDEGTAMLKIVHDIAPGAELYFFDKGSNPIEFIQGVDRLISAGCTIICDDISYQEPYFEDGYIAKNIKDRILSYGILYITSAGNFAQLHYQGPFSGYENLGYSWHNFNGTNSSKDLILTVPPGSAGNVVLQWNDPYSQSSNNYDLYIYDDHDREIGRSVKEQIGQEEPIESYPFNNDGDRPADYHIRVVLAGGENKTIELYTISSTGSQGRLDPYVTGDSIFGQAALIDTISVAAANYYQDNISVQPYSSRGPVSIFYPSREIREKPDITAPDGININTAQGWSYNFYGTSAAAPHIAGMAALIWEAKPMLKREEVAKLLIDAVPGENKRWNPESGWGIPDGRSLIPLLNQIPSLSPKVPELNLSRGFQPRESDQNLAMILYPGWNMISIPYPLQFGEDSSTLFSSINTTGHTIWKYSTE